MSTLKSEILQKATQAAEKACNEIARLIENRKENLVFNSKNVNSETPQQVA